MQFEGILPSSFREKDLGNSLRQQRQMTDTK